MGEHRGGGWEVVVAMIIVVGGRGVDRGHALGSLLLACAARRAPHASRLSEPDA